MAFENIGTFLSKFKNLSAPDGILKEAVISCIQKELSYTLTKKDIDIQRDVVYIRVSGALKNEIHLRKNKILSEIKKVPGDRTINDIR